MALLNNRVFRIIFIVAAGAILLLYFFIEPKEDGFFPKCIFHQLTDLYCPGCGGQRSVHALLHGRFLTAINYNLLFVLLLPLLFYFMFIFVSGKKYEKSSFIYKASFSLSIAIFVVSFWVLRNIPFLPFSWLAP